MIRVYDDAGNVIEPRQYARDFKEPYITRSRLFAFEWVFPLLIASAAHTELWRMPKTLLFVGILYDFTQSFASNPTSSVSPTQNTVRRHLNNAQDMAL